MNIVLFQDLTTNDILSQLESDAAKYDGLYVDMDNKAERKFVKDSAANIGDLLKRLERARIDKAKDYKFAIEKEAAEIKTRLEEANKPFTALIDAHKEKRAKELAALKAIEDAKALAIQIEQDHSDAITMDKIRTFEKKEAEEAARARDEEIARQAREQAEKEKIAAQERAEALEQAMILQQEQAKREAEQRRIDDEKREIEREKQRKIDAENAEKARIQAAEQARLAEVARQEEIKRQDKLAKEKLEANKKHVGAVRGKIKTQLMEALSVEEDMAKQIVLALLKIEQITINY